MTTGGCSGTQYFRCKADMAKTEDFGCACDVALRGGGASVGLRAPRPGSNSAGAVIMFIVLSTRGQAKL